MRKITLLLLTFFFTSLGYSQLPLEGFEGATFPPTNWAVFDTGVGGTATWTSNPASYQGTLAAYMNRQAIAQGVTTEEYLATYLVTIPTNGELRFFARTFAGGNQGTLYQVKVASGPGAIQNDPTTYTLLQEYTEDQLTLDPDGVQNAFNVYTEKIINFPAALYGQQVYVAFVMKYTQPSSGLTGDRWLLDNVQINEKCLVPTALGATPNATVATLNWTGSGTTFEIENILGTGAPTGVATGTSTTNTFSQTGLAPNTNYCYYVRAICSVSSSTWAGPFCYTTTTLPPGCGGNYVDPGGPTANYGNNVDETVVICPITIGDVVTVTFTSFETEPTWDGIYVYNGNNTNAANLIPSTNGVGNGPLAALAGAYWGATTPGPFTSSAVDGCLTFRFRSDGSGVRPGWIANVTCGLPPACPNPNALTSTAPTSNSVNLSWTSNSTATTFNVIALPCGSPAPNASTTGYINVSTNTNALLGGLNADTCYDIYVRDECSSTEFSAWIGPRTITTQPIPPACGGTFTDPAGSSANYANNTNYSVSICPSIVGEVVTVSFTSFNTEANWDGLYVFNGGVVGVGQIPSANGPGNGPLAALAGAYWGTTIPGPFTSSAPDGCLSFNFLSDGVFNNPGWVANVTCGLPPTCPTPTGLTSANVNSNSATLNWTSNSAATSFNIIALPCGSPAPTSTSTGYQTTTTNINALLTGLNADTCYDIYVRDECGIDDYSFWIGPRTITTQPLPPACGGIFTDPAGSNADYLNNTDYSVTICPTNPNDLVTVTFTDFNTEPNFDGLYVYDGNTVGVNQIASANPAGFVPGGVAGSFWGTDIPGPFVSSIPGPTGCLTFRFRSDGSVPRPGWVANVTCTPAPTCPKPVQLNATSVTTSSALLGWIEVGSATQWEIIVVPFGSAPPTNATPGIPTSSNPYLVTALTPGTAYTFYVRGICAADDISEWSAPFTFGSIPLNDDCSGATPAIVNQNLNCVQTTPGSLIGATGSLPPTTCPGAANDDVWFSFTATSITHIISFNNLLPANTDLEYAIFQGTDCGTLTEVGCNSGANLIPGTVYYVRVYSNSTLPQFATFNLCIGTLPCTEAPAFCTGQTVTYQNSTNIPSLGQIGCLFTSPNPAFFFLQVNQAGPLSYLISQVDNGGIPRDVDYVAWGPFTDLSTACTGVPANPLPGILPALTPAQGCGTTIHACSYSAAPTEIMCIPNAQLCEVYVVMITNFSNQAGSVTFTQTNTGGGTTECFPINTFNYPLTSYCQDGVDPTPVLAPGASAGTYTSTPAGLSINSATGAIDLSASMPGTYIVTSTTLTSTGGACTNIPSIITTRTVIITAPANATISYPDTTYCNNINTPINVSVVGTTGGTYSATPSGLFISPINGSIIPGISAQGVYTITYTIPAIGGCAAFSTTTQVEILQRPIVPFQANVTVCDNYILPSLTSGNYYTATGGTGTLLNAGDVINASQTVYVYANNGICSDEKVFTITVNTTPQVPTLNNVSQCSNYVLPALSVGNYYTATGGTGTMLNAGDIISTSQTIYIYAQTTSNPICSSETSFTITIGTLNIIPPTSASYCDSYTLPALTIGNYYTASGGTGNQLNPGDIINSSQTIYIYAVDGTCVDEDQFTITINSVLADDPNDVFACDSYILPALSAGNNYYSAPNGGGNLIPAGTVITSTQTIYVYAQTGSVPNCVDENDFVVTIYSTPIPDAPSNVVACDSYTLPALLVGNYYTQTNGGGNMLVAGTVIESTQTLYVYAQSSTTPNCSAENSFTITINSIVAQTLNNVSACDSYILQSLNPNNFYFTGSGGTGNQLNAGDVITSSQTLYVYAQTGTSPNCTDESSFTITIVPRPILSPVAAVSACDSYVLPTLSNGNYFTQPNGGGTQLASGDVITSSQTIYVYAQSALSGCDAQDSFEVTISQSPVFNIEGECVGPVFTLFLAAGSNIPANANYQWYNGTSLLGTDSTQVITTAGNYSCIVTVSDGSGGTCYTEQPYEAGDILCIIPKGISPNNDGDNDFFNLSGFNVSKLNIYNRYGTIVYSKAGYVNEWVGQSDNGNELPDGTYYYVIERNNAESKTGWVYINRNAN